MENWQSLISRINRDLQSDNATTRAATYSFESANDSAAILHKHSVSYVAITNIKIVS